MRRLAILPLVACLACSGDDGNPDAGSAQASLEILDPPGDSIGLPFGGDVELGVRFRGGDGEVVENIGVNFELVSGPSEVVGGATLSASIAGTSGDGIASVTLTAGASDSNFRVRASAPGAPPATFFVVVSNSGFAAFEVAVSHGGPRPESDYQNIEFRLYDPTTLSCTDLDIDDLPDSVLPPRNADGLEGVVEFTNLAAARPYTLLAWGENTAGDTRLGFGCVELSSEQVMPGQSLAITAPLIDRALRFAVPVATRSIVVLSGLGAALDTAVGPDPWRTVPCDLGAAQLLLDCALDRAIPDGALDCVPTASDPLLDDVEALRGALDLLGCRPDEVSPGVASLDRDLLDQMNAGPWTETDAIALANARDQLLSGLVFNSELSALTPTLATHALVSVRLVGGGLTYDEVLTSSSRPVIRDPAIAASVGEDGVVTLSSHGFTLDLERTAAGAFDTELLPAHGLGGRDADLGSALAESFAGCSAFSSAVCTRISRPASCLEVACDSAAVDLDARLRAWLGAIAASGLDFRVSGSARIEDRDFDLAVDVVGNGDTDPSGEWVVELDTSAGVVSGVSAFGGP